MMKELQHPPKKQTIRFSLNLELLKKILSAEKGITFSMDTLKYKYTIVQDMSHEDMKALANFLITRSIKPNSAAAAKVDA
jgi:hypothetical protein